MSLPPVTVVSAVWNLVEQGRAETFAQMCASVAAQDLPGVEHVVIDGASGDGTQALLARAQADHPGLIVVSEPDRGIYDAMNKGAARARGTHVIFLNSDDFFHDPAFLRRSLAALDAAQADFAYGAARVLKTDGRTRILRPKPARFLRGMPFNHQTMLLRRDLFHDLGGFDADLRILSDFRLTLRLLLTPARGADTGAPGVTFRAGGLSGDRAQVAREKAAIYTQAFAPWLDLPQAAWHRYATRRKLPMALLWRLLRAPGQQPRTRRAALYEMQNTLLKPGRP